MDNIWQDLIQPQRSTFTIDQLGSETRRFDADTTLDRHDGTVMNQRKNILHYNFYKLRESSPAAYASRPQTQTCMVYLHSHGGNRLESLSLIRYAGRLGLNFCFFDFAGHGMSEGEYCTLGFRESEDCQAVLDELKNKFGQERFVLWGRSMGAVAAIVYATRNSRLVDYLILDSPFTSVDQIVRDYGARFIKIGEYVAVMMFNMAKDDINYRTGCDLANFRPIDFCTFLDIPCVFVVAYNDDLVPPERVDEMFRCYKSVQRNMVTIEGTHSSGRSSIDLDKIVEYLQLFYKISFKNNMNSQSKIPFRVADRMTSLSGSLVRNMQMKMPTEYKLETKKDFEISKRRIENKPQLISSISNANFASETYADDKSPLEQLVHKPRLSHQKLGNIDKSPNQGQRHPGGSYIGNKLNRLSENLKSISMKTSAPVKMNIFASPQFQPVNRVAEQAFTAESLRKYSVNNLGSQPIPFESTMDTNYNEPQLYDRSIEDHLNIVSRINTHSNGFSNSSQNHSYAMSPVAPVRLQHEDPFARKTNSSIFSKIADMDERTPQMSYVRESQPAGKIFQREASGTYSFHQLAGQHDRNMIDSRYVNLKPTGSPSYTQSQRRLERTPIFNVDGEARRGVGPTNPNNEVKEGSISNSFRQQKNSSMREQDQQNSFIKSTKFGNGIFHTLYPGMINDRDKSGARTRMIFDDDENQTPVASFSKGRDISSGRSNPLNQSAPTDGLRKLHLQSSNPINYTQNSDPYSRYS